MENNYAKEMTEVLANSLDNTQRNAVDIENFVQQICDLSGQDVYRKVIEEILSDKDTESEEKVSLIQKVNTDYDQREENNTRRLISLQAAQTQNVAAASRWWGSHWGWVVMGSLFIIGIGTPGGRKVISSAAKYLLSA